MMLRYTLQSDEPELFTTGERPHNRFAPHHDTSYAYFCPQCGEVWAKYTLFRPGGQVCFPFLAIHKPCPKHGGALFANSLDEECFNAYMPPEALAHDILYMLDHEQIQYIPRIQEPLR